MLTSLFALFAARTVASADFKGAQIIPAADVTINRMQTDGDYDAGIPGKPILFELPEGCLCARGLVVIVNARGETASVTHR